MLPDRLLVQVLSGSAAFQTDSFRSAASQTDFFQRTIPLDMLDINATIAANREREVDLRIPADRNEISLSF